MLTLSVRCKSLEAVATIDATVGSNEAPEPGIQVVPDWASVWDDLVLRLQWGFGWGGDAFPDGHTALPVLSDLIKKVLAIEEKV